MKDTLRILVGWECNLKCAYCCNEQPQIRGEIKPTSLDEIQWSNYSTFCITGGEPLLRLDRVGKVVDRIPEGKLIILYTNGILLNKVVMHSLSSMNVAGINVGLHKPATFSGLIRRISVVAACFPIQVRFHANEIYQEELEREFPFTSFRFWRMNDCDRTNEDRVVVNW